jgi:uncharacterized protein HemX
MPKEPSLSFSVPALPPCRRSPRRTVDSKLYSESRQSSNLSLCSPPLTYLIAAKISAGARDQSEKQTNLLRATVKRLKSRLQEKSEDILDLKTEIQHMKNEVERLERESDKKDEMLEGAARDVEQYRTWWLNEIQFMKLLLNKIPEPNRDIELVRASQAHYLGHY